MGCGVTGWWPDRPPQPMLLLLSVLIATSLTTTTTTTTTTTAAAAKTTISIGGFFELSTPLAEQGQSELAAAQLALQHINQVNFLPNYHLELIFNDTQCDPGVGADAFFHAVYNKPAMLMVIGSSCSEVTEHIAEVVPYFNLVLISYGSTSPALSERARFPTFFRLATADSSHNLARLQLMLKFSWATVATLHQDVEVYSLAVSSMNKIFERANITFKATLAFSYRDLEAKMRDLKDSDARIIIASFDEEIAPRVLCYAFHLRLYGPRYVWLFLSWYESDTWARLDHLSLNCTSDQIMNAFDGYFRVGSLGFILGNELSIANTTTAQFYADFNSSYVIRRNSVIAQAYDSVWATAMTLKQAMALWKHRNQNYRLEQFNYGHKEMSDTFFEVMQNLDFLGVSGSVSFRGPDRVGISVLWQRQNSSMQPVALFFPHNESLNFECGICTKIRWKGDRIPVSKDRIRVEKKVIEKTAFWVVFAAGIFGILLSVSFLSFNLIYRKTKLIKLSSPKMNNVAVIGCIHVYIGLCMFGLDDATISSADSYPAMCTIRAMLFANGFSLSFGAMFFKTYRVHEIFTRSASFVRNKLLKDKQLLLILACLYVVDCVVLTMWIVIDPMHRHVKNFTAMAHEDSDFIIIPQLAKCHSQHLDKWLGAIYAYKGLLLVFGVYMAWETRNVKIPALNDSQYIGTSVYIVVVMSIIIVVVSSVISDKQTLCFVTVSTCIFLSTTVTLALLFVPKIYGLIKYQGADPVLHGTGLKVECNTRRLAVEDDKELLYRANVQNRAFKKDIVDMDREIERIENTLESPVTPYLPIDEELFSRLPETPVDETPPATKRRKTFAKMRSSQVEDDDAESVHLTSAGRGESAVNAAANVRDAQNDLDCSLERSDSGISSSTRLNSENSFPMRPLYDLNCKPLATTNPDPSRPACDLGPSASRSIFFIDKEEELLQLTHFGDLESHSSTACSIEDLWLDDVSRVTSTTSLIAHQRRVSDLESGSPLTASPSQRYTSTHFLRLAAPTRAQLTRPSIRIKRLLKSPEL